MRGSQALAYNFLALTCSCVEASGKLVPRTEGRAAAAPARRASGLRQKPALIDQAKIDLVAAQFCRAEEKRRMNHQALPNFVRKTTSFQENLRLFFSDFSEDFVRNLI